ncbi:MAG: diacylglycerol kinase [Rhodobacteraceae bacterium]|nr:diacylglycerol kinase [Paracoccaceae bacterium]MCB1368596.1 diacylglycerol kinase [Paracoccaceae bacterium]
MAGFWKRQVVRVSNATIWSIAGARATWASEANFRQWTLANVLSAMLAFWLDLSGLERAVIIGFGLMILVAELANTAIETTVDRISLDQHPLSRKAKDIGSAVVALSALIALAVWLLILFG